ncbi:hypothetical protein V6667_09285 [Neisseria leonii]|uniref:Uncharacterized protein n=1 Tax=Neisseria leonii TaxID=2995413 RepID=A0A9X4E1J0_9NEIS|nr:hypothetical protein [Neisseria sp. 51.81]MDD9327847.1 hypothetical protein [Neisseria sp. 51.81]
MRNTGSLLLAATGAAYPIVWYFGREYGVFPWLAVLMCGLWLLRAVQARGVQRRVACSAAAFFAAAVFWGRPGLMYWYPVAVSLLMLAVFGSSLFAGRTVIERLARLRYPDLPEKGVRHTRRVTQIWCVFFVFNAAVAAWLALSGRYDWWAAYTGAVSYGLMGLLFGGEWLYRKAVLKL